MADICNKIGIIERGQLLFDGDVDSAIKQVRERVVYLVQVANGMNAMAKEHLDAHHQILSIELKNEGELLRITLNDNVEDGSFLAEELIKKGFRVKTLKEEEVDLEDVFLKITKGVTN